MSTARFALSTCRARVLPVLAAAMHLLPSPAACETQAWNATFQTTYVSQFKPSLRSPYASDNSLKAEREWSYSFTATAAFGMRVGPRTEVYLDPEVAQGVAPSGLVGTAGFTNGELARTSGSNPSVYRARLFLRHGFDLSTDTEAVEPAMNQLGGSQGRRRLVLTAGNLSLLDLFDANASAHDPRSQFMNWALMTHAAYDYAADARGYTWGAAAEYVGEGWSLRAGRFAQPREPNQLALDLRLTRHFGDQVEWELPYALGRERPGTLRVLVFRNRAVMARFDDALALADATGTVPDLNQVRRGEQVKTGAGVNLEQRLRQGVDVFARAMKADGRTEVFAFTEADRSMSAGLALGGVLWDRADDGAGVAWAQSSLSAPHRRYFERGGNSFFLGDGALQYRPEQILEAYYRWSPARGVALSLDGQRITGPGYNAARGPARFWAVRLHLEY